MNDIRTLTAVIMIPTLTVLILFFNYIKPEPVQGVSLGSDYRQIMEVVIDEN